MSDENVARKSAVPQDRDAYHYFRDHQMSGAWGVRATATGRVVAVGLDKTEALVIALFFSGRFQEADEVWSDFRKNYRSDEVSS